MNSERRWLVAILGLGIIGIGFPAIFLYGWNHGFELVGCEIEDCSWLEAWSWVVLFMAGPIFVGGGLIAIAVVGPIGLGRTSAVFLVGGVSLTALGALFLTTVF
jgi:hypothetical protein